MLVGRCLVIALALEGSAEFAAPAIAKPTMIQVEGTRSNKPLPPLTAREQAHDLALRVHVQTIAGKIGARSCAAPGGLGQTVAWLERELRVAGLVPRRQPYEADGKTYVNLEATIAGHARASEVVIVGAHYDAVAGTVGANDNGSGVAAALVLATSFAHARPARTVRFVFFANEEPPHFQSDAMGSLVYARACRARGESVLAMLSLETIGYYTDAAKSQHYPGPLAAAFPDRGNFVAFVGDVASASLLKDSVGAFKAATPFPVEGAALPTDLPGVGWSDHWAFWQAGYRALMVTDTAPFRYPHYHSTQDTPDKLRYDALARVVTGLEGVLRHLAR